MKHVEPLKNLWNNKVYYKAASCWYFYWALSLGNSRSPYGHINQRLKIQFRAPDDERCAA